MAQAHHKLQRKYIKRQIVRQTKTHNSTRGQITKSHYPNPGPVASKKRQTLKFQVKKKSSISKCVKNDSIVLKNAQSA